MLQSSNESDDVESEKESDDEEEEDDSDDEEEDDDSEEESDDDDDGAGRSFSPFKVARGFLGGGGGKRGSSRSLGRGSPA